jgi:DNA-binding MurR/RpiR family transcriptional regulator
MDSNQKQAANTPVVGSGIISRITSSLPFLSEANKRIAEFVVANPNEVTEMSVTSLAENCDVGEATVIRFCQSLNLKGFQDLKLSLAKDLVIPLSNIDYTVTASDDIATIASKISYWYGQIGVDTLEVVNVEHAEKAADLMLKARRIFFYGVGFSALSALEAQRRFTCLGLNCDCVMDPHFASMTASTLGSEDLAVFFSQTGSTKDVADCLDIVKQSGVETVAVTSYLKSPIARKADVVLLTSVIESPLAGGGAFRSRIAQLFIINLLYTITAIKLQGKGLEVSVKAAQAVLEKLY